MASMGCGLLTEILPYINKEDLKNQLRLSEPVTNLIDVGKYRIFIAHVTLPYSLNASTKAILSEKYLLQHADFYPRRCYNYPSAYTHFSDLALEFSNKWCHICGKDLLDAMIVLNPRNQRL